MRYMIMSSASVATAASDRLLQLIGRIEALPDFAEVVDSLQAGHAATLDGVWGSSCALVAAALAKAAPAVLVVVCPRLDEVQGLIGELSLFSPLEPMRFPVRESLSAERMVQDEAVGDRVRVLKTLLAPQPPKVLVTSIPALLAAGPQPVAIGRTNADLAGRRVDFRGGDFRLARAQRLSEHDGRGIARRVLASRRNHRHFRSRLVQSRAD